MDYTDLFDHCMLNLGEVIVPQNVHHHSLFMEIKVT